MKKITWKTYQTRSLGDGSARPSPFLKDLSAKKNKDLSSPDEVAFRGYSLNIRFQIILKLTAEELLNGFLILG
jgi:hypothetical protein